MSAATSIRGVAVVGLGLIGGSMARDLAARGVRVLGWDRDALALREARREGVVHAALEEDLAGAAEADAIVLALPVDAARDALERVRHAAPAATLVTDVGSTKRTIVAAAEALGLGERFVGAHPLAGDHRSGWSASRRGLFAGARVFVCPADGASPGAIEGCERLWELLGARPERMEAARHDEMLAWTSHLPHVLSAALAATLARAGLRPGDLGPGGRGMTRLAGGSPELWAAIARDNAEAIVEALEGVERQLQDFRAALRDGDRGALQRQLAAAHDWYAADQAALGARLSAIGEAERRAPL